jgi:hypothetical protein
MKWLHLFSLLDLIKMLTQFVFYFEGDCVCRQIGTLDNKCHRTTNKCICKEGVGGARCDSCIPGYWNLISGNGCIREYNQ